MQRYY